MKAERSILVVARRFWPTITDGTLWLQAVIEQWVRAGLKVEVVTNRPVPNWSRKIYFGPVPVHRYEQKSRLGWGQSGYLRKVVEHVQGAAAKFDLLAFVECGAEARSVLTKVPPAVRPPAVVYFDGLPNAVHAVSPSEVCRAADLVVVPHQLAHRRLLALGELETPVIRHSLTAINSVQRDIGSRRRARQVLGGTNQELFLRVSDRLVVCPGELNDTWNIDWLLHQLIPLVESQKHFRLWLLGDGPQRSNYYRRLQDAGLHRHIAMPGTFTDLELVLQAADICVFPSTQHGAAWLIPTCAANGIPMLVADSADNRRVLEDSSMDKAESDVFFSVDDSNASLRERTKQWLEDPSKIERITLQIQQRCGGRADSSAPLDVLWNHLPTTLTQRRSG